MDDFDFPWEADGTEAEDEFADLDLPWKNEAESKEAAVRRVAASQARYSQGWDAPALAYALADLGRRVSPEGAEPPPPDSFAGLLPGFVEELRGLSRLLDFVKHCKFDPNASNSIVVSQQLTLRKTFAGLLEPQGETLRGMAAEGARRLKAEGAGDRVDRALFESTQAMERQIVDWEEFAELVGKRVAEAVEENAAAVKALEFALAASTNPHLHVSKLSPFFTFALAQDASGSWILWRAREALARVSALQLPDKAREAVRDLSAHVEAVALLARGSIGFSEPRTQQIGGEIAALLEQMFQLADPIALDPKTLLMRLFNKTGPVQVAMDGVAKDASDKEAAGAASALLEALKPLERSAARAASAYRSGSSSNVFDSGAIRALS